MRYKYQASDNNISFSKWTRKGYAVFAGLGKLITIARLSIDIFKSFFCKNKTVRFLLNIEKNKALAENGYFDKKAIFSEWFMLLIIELGIITVDELSSTAKSNRKPGRSPFFA